MSNFGAGASEMFMDRPPTSQMYDTRTGYQMAQERGRMQDISDTTQQYKNSMTDPSFAIASPELQRMQEQELTDQTFNRMGSAAGGGSARALAQKALVDYRLGLIDKQNAARENLRQNLVNLYGQGAPGYHAMDVGGKASPMTQTETMVGQAAASAGGKAMGGV